MIKMTDPINININPFSWINQGWQKFKERILPWNIPDWVQTARSVPTLNDAMTSCIKGEGMYPIANILGYIKHYGGLSNIDRAYLLRLSITCCILFLWWFIYKSQPIDNYFKQVYDDIFDILETQANLFERPITLYIKEIQEMVTEVKGMCMSIITESEYILDKHPLLKIFIENKINDTSYLDTISLIGTYSTTKFTYIKEFIERYKNDEDDPIYHIVPLYQMLEIFIRYDLINGLLTLYETYKEDPLTPYLSTLNFSKLKVGSNTVPVLCYIMRYNKKYIINHFLSKKHKFRFDIMLNTLDERNETPLHSCISNWRDITVDDISKRISSNIAFILELARKEKLAGYARRLESGSRNVIFLLALCRFELKLGGEKVDVLRLPRLSTKDYEIILKNFKFTTNPNSSEVENIYIEEKIGSSPTLGLENSTTLFEYICSMVPDNFNIFYALCNQIDIATWDKLYIKNVLKKNMIDSNPVLRKLCYNKDDNDRSQNKNKNKNKNKNN